MPQPPEHLVMAAQGKGLRGRSATPSAVTSTMSSGGLCCRPAHGLGQHDLPRKSFVVDMGTR
jgi:hypothetical protein